ncbi:hypothetical protein ACTI_85540 [Actinoplanes sp. OR16]|uniref:hypothetical protein n=1 Tax=Actinoplanes sp. OR16 TaxID=946334 RepID=UPI000F70B9DB|nr:hypothetical protein [Actinoplanes sp. OR16]BBH71869.1 hypothetical protein ACTI_85540 [Actinoplanes sp. OR16]
MADQATDLPGIKVRKIRGQRYVVVRVAEAFDRDVAIADLAARLRLHPEGVFRALLGFTSNAPVVRDLYAEEFAEEPFPGLAAARVDLRSRGDSPYYANFDTPARPAFHNWRIPAKRTVVLPFAGGFREVMAEATVQRRRELRLTVIRPVFEPLAHDLNRMRGYADSLAHITNLHRTLISAVAGDIAVLEALNGLLGVLLQFPKEPPADAGDRRDLEDLRRKLDTLRERARTDLIENPVDPFLAGLLRDQAKTAQELRVMVEDPAFVGRVREIVGTLATGDTRTLVPEQLWDDVQETLLRVFRALLSSPQADRVVDTHVLPMIQALASRPFDLTGLSAPNRPLFDQAVRSVPAAPPDGSVLVTLSTLGTAAATVTALAGNYPGPNTLLVGIVELSSPILLGRVVGQVTEASRLSGWLYRAVVNLASLDQVPFGRPLTMADRVALIEAVDRGDLARLRGVNWTSRFMNSGAWGPVIAVCGVIALAAAIDADNDNTVVYWSNIIASGSTAVTGVAVSFASFSNLIGLRIVQGVSGRVIGAIGAVAVIVSGAAAAVEGYRTDDVDDMVIGAATAFGGGLSLAGLLIAAGVISAPAGVGLLLMVAGVVVGIAITVYTFVQSITTAGSRNVFSAYLAHFARTAGPYAEAEASRPLLRDAFRAVENRHDDVDFWDAHPDRAPELYDLGFGFEGDNQAIQKIVDVDDGTVIRLRLIQAKRITR